MRNSAKQWPHIPLGELAEIERNAVSPENIKSGTKYVGLENMTSSGSFVGVAEVATGDLASTKFAFTDRHILYGKLRPYLAKIARPRFPGVCSTDILPILPGSKVDPGFLLHFLRQPRMVDYASSKTTGANLPRLSPKALAEFEIPLPPLSEQKRIADILDKADSIRRKRQEADALLTSVRSAVFHERFGDPVANPKSWEVVKLGDYQTKMQFQIQEVERISKVLNILGL
jgi:type I restriction enzyme S subunit